MKILFVHQNFPGQYRHIARTFADDPGNQVIGIGQRDNLGRLNHPRVRELGYPTPQGASAKTHHYLRRFEAAVRRGQQVVRLADQLRNSDYVPDIICCHPGWGEGLYLRDIWPSTPLLYFFEFYYHAEGFDTGFDPEFPRSFDDRFAVRSRNALHLLSLNVADWGVTPTRWQWSSLPREYRDKISVIFDGVDTDLVRPSDNATVKIDARTTLTRDHEVITFINRNLEPYRGYHIFMRALPQLLAERPNAQVIIVGGDEVSYGSAPRDAASHKQKYLDEVKDRLDLDRVHFLGRVPYTTFLSILQISSAHVYLTYPFVLSWSMIEAMSAGCAVVASATPPVEEMIRDGHNGLLFDFFSTEQLTTRVCEVLDHPDRMQEMRKAARRTVVERYDLNTICLPQHRALIETIAAGGRPAASDAGADQDRVKTTV